MLHPQSRYEERGGREAMSVEACPLLIAIEREEITVGFFLVVSVNLLTIEQVPQAIE